MDELHYLTLTELAARIRRRELSPRDVVEHQLARIARLDPELHAFVRVTADVARQQADDATAQLAGGAPTGPLHGVPIGVKDLCDTAGVPTEAGMAVFAGRVPAEDAEVVRRLRGAGAILLGKLTTTEGAGILHHPTIPVPLNPWNREHWCGASSSGSGVATAAGLCFGAIGTDTAGSIRFPSACNAVVGLKPTFGRVPAEGVFPLAPSLDHVGPMARSVQDVAALFGVMSGERVELQAGAGRAPFTIGLDEAYCQEGVDATLSSAVLAAARHLESIGARVVPVQMGRIDAAVAAFGVVFHAEVARVHAPYRAARPSAYGPHFGLVVGVGDDLTAAQVEEAGAIRRSFTDELHGLLGTVDAVIAPPAMTAPPPADLMTHVPPDFRHMAGALRYTAPYDLAGVPSLTLPCGFTSERVPLGFQLIGAPGTEARLLRIGDAYEATTEVHLRHPLP